MNSSNPEFFFNSVNEKVCKCNVAEDIQSEPEEVVVKKTKRKNMS